MKFSYFQQLKPNDKLNLLNQFSTNQLLINIHAYVIMTDHFHFLIQQSKKNGIRTFMQKLLNSYSHFYNILNKRMGPLFEGNFRAILIEHDNYLIHLARYIHLNPVTAYIVKDPANYPHSSYNIYLGNKKLFPPITTKTILSYFKNIKEFQEFHLKHKYEQRLTAKIRKELLIDYQWRSRIVIPEPQRWRSGIVEKHET